MELLRNTNLSMERIMEETGYSNMNNFTVALRSISGRRLWSSGKWGRDFDLREKTAGRRKKRQEKETAGRRKHQQAVITAVLIQES